MNFSLYSHQIPKMFPIALYFVPILCLKFYFYNLYNQSEGVGYNISILGLSIDFLIFLMGESKMPFKKEKNWTLGVLITD